MNLIDRVHTTASGSTEANGEPTTRTGWAVAIERHTREGVTTRDEVAAHLNSEDTRRALEHPAAVVGHWTNLGHKEVNVSHVVADRTAAFALAHDQHQREIAHLVRGEYKGVVDTGRWVTVDGHPVFIAIPDDGKEAQ